MKQSGGLHSKPLVSHKLSLARVLTKIVRLMKRYIPYARYTSIGASFSRHTLRIPVAK